MGQSFQSRMKQIAELSGSAQALANKSGVSRRAVGKYLAGDADPSRAILLKLAAAADVSLEWLATGKGEPRGPEANAPSRLNYHSAALSDELRAREPGAGYVYLPLYDLRAAAGTRGIVIDDGERPVSALAFREDWIRSTLRVDPGDLRLIFVEGDSMEPDLRAGDIIMVDHTDTMARREGIYVVRMDDALLVKQLQRLPGGQVRVTSRNSAYQPFQVTAADLEEHNTFAVVGRVVWACRRF